MINPEESLLQIYDIACFSLNQIAHGKAMDCFVLRGDLTTQRGFLAGGGGTSTTALFSFGDGSFNFLSAQRKRKKSSMEVFVKTCKETTEFSTLSAITPFGQ